MRTVKLLANLILGTALSGVIWASALACGNTYAHGMADPVLNRSREMAAKYLSIETAKADGYQQLFECTAHDEHGNMGVHFIHPRRAGDGKLTLGEPDVLTYEPESDGSMQLVGMEYIVFEKDWKGKGVPEFLGRTLQRKTTVGVHPVDPYYELHVWHWRHNPAGMFADWNPYVSCQYDQS
jgi:hypothetical protein